MAASVKARPYERERELGYLASMRIVIWNIRAGGGRREAEIADQVARWRADLVAFSEFRATPPSLSLQARLRQQGLHHQRTTASAEEPARNALLLASRWRLRRLRLIGEPEEPGRWLVARVQSPPPITIAALHAPNYVTGRKTAFFDAVLSIAARWNPGPAIIAGDTNSTIRALDEQNPNPSFPEEHFLAEFAALGWSDVFRTLHGCRRVYSWYSPNAGNGFRLDQTLANAAMLPRILGVSYRWGRRRGAKERRDALSDHQAMVVDIDPV